LKSGIWLGFKHLGENLGSFSGIMTPKTSSMLFYHTKGIFSRRTTYFEPSDVKIGSGVWALQVRKNEFGKGRKLRISVGIFTHLWGSMG
jgi:hypothetical protein